MIEIYKVKSKHFKEEYDITISDNGSVTGYSLYLKEGEDLWTLVDLGTYNEDEKSKIEINYYAGDVLGDKKKINRDEIWELFK